MATVILPGFGGHAHHRGNHHLEVGCRLFGRKGIRGDVDLPQHGRLAFGAQGGLFAQSRLEFRGDGTFREDEFLNVFAGIAVDLLKPLLDEIINIGIKKNKK